MISTLRHIELYVSIHARVFVCIIPFNNSALQGLFFTKSIAQRLTKNDFLVPRRALTTSLMILDLRRETERRVTYNSRKKLISG